MLVRKAQHEDYDQLLALLQQLNPDDPLPSPVQREVFGHILRSEHLALIVADVDGVLAGSCYLNLIQNLTRGASPYAVIENVVTDSRYRRQGVGRAVMQHALALASEAGCYKTMLMTGRKDAGVEAFYRACGFVADAKQAWLIRQLR